MRKIKKSKEYVAWLGMRSRCYNPKGASYKNYGGRGIKVCKRWLDSFEHFLTDMGKAPTIKHSLDRFPDNDGHYKPSNCRWATPIQQNNNTSRNLISEHGGVKMTVSEWCRELNLNPHLVYERLKKGISFKEAINPIKAGNKNRAIFSNDQRLEICNLYKSGKKKSEITAMFNSRWSTIHSIIKSEAKSGNKS